MSTRAAVPAARRTPARRVAVTSTWVVVAALTTASAAGLLVDGLYPDGTAVSAALRGGDLLNLTVAVPTLVAALVLSERGSRRGRLVQLGVLAYVSYAYGYYVFTPTFNDVFLAHVVVLVGALCGVVAGLADGDVLALAGAPPSTARARAVGGFLLLVSAALLWTWGSSSLRFALTGEPPTDVLPYPEWRVHLGYVMDLVFVAPAAALAGILLWRRTACGYVLGAVVATWLFVYQLNFLVSTVFIAAAGVPGVAVDAVPIATCAVFAVPAAALLIGPRAPSRAASRTSAADRARRPAGGGATSPTSHDT